MINSDELILLGDAEALMHRLPGQQALLQSEVISAFLQLQSDAVAEGFNLQIASGFRSFSRQLSIWNGKIDGSRPLVDENDQLLNPQQLASWRCVEAIMRFSALPGLSRHHWGSDIDVYDAAALPDGYRLQLTLAETQAEGPFAALHRWLDERIAANRSYGFYRPYAVDLGGIAPEPWHLSYAPLAQHYESLLQTPLLYQRLNTEPILLKEYLLTVLPQLLQRYGLAVTPPPWEISRG
jgi:LAS superfamily LD-carboxypeptidase LdcB